MTMGEREKDEKKWSLEDVANYLLNPLTLSVCVCVCVFVCVW
jgi:hypothetical protein